MHQNNHTAFSRPALIVILLMAASLYLFTLTDNHIWWGDFALYMAHAGNIAQGLPYADTGYVVNPAVTWLSPPAYPPVFPYMLAPIYKLFGLDLLVPKLFILSLFLLLVGLFYWYAAQHLNNRISAFGAAAALAMSPWFWDMRNLILSDIPFVLFTFFATLLVAKLHQTRPGQAAFWSWTILLGLVFYLAYGTRSLGITLPAALIAYDLLGTRRIRLSSMLVIAVFAACYGLQNIFLDVDKSYASAMVNHAMRDTGEAPAGFLETAGIMVNYFLNNIAQRSEEYVWVVQAYWDNGVSLAFRVVMVVLTGILAITGYVSTVRRKLSFAEVFVLVYLATLLLVPFIQTYRYLLPLIPFFMLYIFAGVETIISTCDSKPLRYMPHALTGLIALSYLGAYASQLPPEMQPGVRDTESVELFEYMKRELPDDSLIICKKPRIIALFTGLHSSIYWGDHNQEELWNYFDDLQATHLLVNTGKFTEDQPAYISLVDESLDRLELKFENQAFKLYRIKPR